MIADALGVRPGDLLVPDEELPQFEKMYREIIAEKEAKRNREQSTEGVA